MLLYVSIKIARADPNSAQQSPSRILIGCGSLDLWRPCQLALLQKRSAGSPPTPTRHSNMEQQVSGTGMRVSVMCAKKKNCTCASNRGDLLELVVFRIGLLAAIRSKCTKGEQVLQCGRY